MGDRVLGLFEDYAVARARGERPDVLEYLRRAGPEAHHLGLLIDGLVTTAPPPDPAAEVVAMVGALVNDEPPLLGARLHRRLTVDSLVDALVDAFGLHHRRARVKDLYQRLEGGLIDPRRIDPRLADALAHALGIRSRDVALGAPAPPPADLLFARAPAGPSGPLEDRVTAVPPPDEVDRLFGLR